MNELKEDPSRSEEPMKGQDFNISMCEGKDTQFLSNSLNVIEDFSPEVEKLYRLIRDKKNYLAKLTNDYARKKVQVEILFLQNEILPIVLNETTLLFSEITKHLTAKIHDAVNAGADAMVMVIPLLDRSDDTIKIATVNPHRDNPIEGIEIGIEANGRQIEEVKL